MPAAAAPPPRTTGGGPSPPDPADDLGFPAPLRDPAPVPTGTEVETHLKSSEEDHTPDPKRSEAAADSEDVRTPGGSEFFLRKPQSSEKNPPLGYEAFTYEQYMQLCAQIGVFLDLKRKQPPTKDKMVRAFGEPVEGQVHAWEEAWLEWESKKAPLVGLDTPPSSSLSDSCISEEDSEAKIIISEPRSSESHVDSVKNEGGEEVSGDLDDGSARIEPAKHDPGYQAVTCSDRVDQVPFDDGNNLKKNTTGSWQALLESRCCSVTVQHSEIRSGTGNISSPIQGWTEQDWCVKCGKDGQLLNCYSCSLAAHRSCLGSLVRFNDSGEFCCPVCYHKAAAEEFEKVKKKYSEARKNLHDFFGSKQSANQHGNHQSEATNPSRKDEEPAREKRDATSDASCREEIVTGKTATSGPNPVDAKNHEVGNSSPSNEVPQPSQARFGPTIANYSSEAAKEKGPTNSPMTHRRQVRFHEKETVVSNSYYGKASGRQDQYVHSPARKRYYPYPPDCYSTPARSPLAPRRRSIVSTVRRARLLWTAEEEAALREAVARFAPKDKGQISWVQILEHCGDVFHPRRLPKDLTQKWYSMKKRDEAAREGAGLAGLDPTTRRASLPTTWRKEACKDLRKGRAGRKSWHISVSMLCLYVSSCMGERQFQRVT